MSTDAKVAALAANHPTLPIPILASILSTMNGDVARAEALLQQMMAPPVPTAAASSAAKKKPPSKSSGPLRSTAEICGSGAQTCGYCKTGKKTTISYGVVCATLLAEDYQSMIDIGWRRSGTYCQYNTSSD